MLNVSSKLEKSLPSLSAEAADNLSGSYFEETWSAMHKALQKMYAKYPDDWKDTGVYDDLAVVLEEYYNKMGWILSTVGGRAYVNIPFRPGAI